MKRLIFTAALSLSLAGPVAFSAIAQQTAPPPPADTQGPPAGRMHRPRDPHRQAEMLSKHLNLTPDQTSRLEPILADRQSRMDALRSNTSLDQKARHEQMRSIQEDTQTKMAGVLTPDQLQQLKQMRGGMGRHGRGGPNGPGGQDAPPPPPPTN